MIEWLNLNEGITNILLSIISLIIAFIAIIISVLTAKRQNKIALFEKRYEVYNRFSELIQMAEIVSHKALTSKEKLRLYNFSFFGVKNESSNIGQEISKIDDKLSIIDSRDEKYKKFSDMKIEKAKKKSVLDYSILVKDEVLLSKSKLLFNNNDNDDIKEFFKIYSDVVMSANFTEIDSMDELFERWNKTCIKLRKEKYLENMEKYINLNK